LATCQDANGPAGASSLVVKIINEVHGGEGSMLARYRRMTAGEAGWGYFIRLELCMLLFRNLPGALGLWMRKLFFPGLFGACGRGVLFGTGLTLRNPRAIRLGDRVVIDENVVLDAKGMAPGGMEIGDNVFLSRNVLLVGKGGEIHIGARCSLGPNAIVHSLGQGCIRIGGCTAIAANCYIIAGGTYRHDRTDIPMIDQGQLAEQGIEVGEDVWLAVGVVLVDGVRIGRGSIIGAMSLVRGEIPAWSVAYGVPATVHKTRAGGDKPA